MIPGLHAIVPPMKNLQQGQWSPGGCGIIFMHGHCGTGSGATKSSRQQRLPLSENSATVSCKGGAADKMANVRHCLWQVGSQVASSRIVVPVPAFVGIQGWMGHCKAATSSLNEATGGIQSEVVLKLNGWKQNLENATGEGSSFAIFVEALQVWFTLAMMKDRSRQTHSNFQNPQCRICWGNHRCTHWQTEGTMHHMALAWARSCRRASVNVFGLEGLDVGQQLPIQSCGKERWGSTPIVGPGAHE
ncbi:hypothetical protein F5J12DRAFT_783531 [Pisolithus orientalis]|uniref:uncharacterized protein n=1 Tax=Pisolithus orientalis TaxID=936130 RepID=UPI002224656E|nr:uncharacterized protein F5J12DRAFT_783531 [Pisolithus orientalis]KAI6003461.1 hypothetical protein F5J12DRAFT_783531 [Pisolithus orientalis]